MTAAHRIKITDIDGEKFLQSPTLGPSPGSHVNLSLLQHSTGVARSKVNYLKP
jgi:hypothetical protein